LNKGCLRQALSSRNLPTKWLSRADTTYTDAKYALKHLGEESVYSFLIADSVVGWLIAVGTVAAQVLLLTPYIEAAEFDLSQTVDLEYTHKCNPSENLCVNTNSVTARGWIIFTILMVVFFIERPHLWVENGKTLGEKETQSQFTCKALLRGFYSLQYHHGKMYLLVVPLIFVPC